jgi:hypothetical protein
METEIIIRFVNEWLPIIRNMHKVVGDTPLGTALSIWTTAEWMYNRFPTPPNFGEMLFKTHHKPGSWDDVNSVNARNDAFVHHAKCEAITWLVVILLVNIGFMIKGGRPGTVRLFLMALTMIVSYALRNVITYLNLNAELQRAWSMVLMFVALVFVADSLYAIFKLRAAIRTRKQLEALDGKVDRSIEGVKDSIAQLNSRVSAMDATIAVINAKLKKIVGADESEKKHDEAPKYGNDRQTLTLLQVQSDVHETSDEVPTREQEEVLAPPKMIPPRRIMTRAAAKARII